MRPYSTIQKLATALKSLTASAILIVVLASFTKGDSSKTNYSAKSESKVKALVSSVGSVNMSRSMLVNRSMKEVHEQFMAKSDKTDFIISTPSLSEITAAVGEVDQNFRFTTMWDAVSGKKMLQASNDEVNSLFEKENNQKITVKPDVKASIEEVNKRFESENKTNQ